MRTCAKAPCKSCPYRCDVPSGMWAKEEYDKLKAYDGDIGEQLTKNAVALFDCHQRDGQLCAGWVATHKPQTLLAVRLHSRDIAPEVFDYSSPVPVFSSGEEAAKHGMRDIRRPRAAAISAIKRLSRKKARDGW